MIYLTGELAMDADSHCFIIGNPRTRPDKGPILDNPRYYSTAAQAVLSTVSRTMRQGVADGSITSLRQFIEEQQRLQAELERLVAPLEPGQAPQRAAWKEGSHVSAAAE